MLTYDSLLSLTSDVVYFVQLRLTVHSPLVEEIHVQVPMRLSKQAKMISIEVIIYS
jgi:hypothetical protein